MCRSALLHTLLRFNSLQVDYQRTCVCGGRKILTRVSIPYRQTINGFFFLHNRMYSLWFQFLIGRLSTAALAACLTAAAMLFQFLIGRLSTIKKAKNKVYGAGVFQFLIGRLSTWLPQVDFCVTSHSFNSLQVDYQPKHLAEEEDATLRSFNSLQVDYQRYRQSSNVTTS